MSLASVRRLSVRPPVNIFVYAQKLEYRLEYFDDTSQLYFSVIQVMTICHIQKMRAVALLLFELSPL